MTAATVALTTKEACKSYSGIEEGTESWIDDFLDAAILAASRWVELYCGRQFLVASDIVRRFDVGPRKHIFHLEAFPLSDVTEIKSSADWDFSNATDLSTDTTLYTREDDRGRLVFRSGVLEVGPASLQITYDGGLVANTAAVIAGHPTLDTVTKQIVDGLWRRRKSLEKETEAYTGTSITREALRVPRIVKDLLVPYRSARSMI